MAILVTRRWSDRSLSMGKEQWNASESYDVTGVDSQYDALNAPGIPQDGESNEANGRLKVTSRECTNIGPALYRVTVTYSMEAPEELEQEDGNLTVWTEDGNETVPVDRDIDGNPIFNSASDPPEQLPTRDTATQVICLKRDEPFFNNQQALVMRNTVNDADFMVAGLVVPKGRGRLISYGIAEPFTLDDEVVTIIYRIMVRPLDNEPPDGMTAFDIRFLNQGFNGFHSGVNGDHGKRGPICSQDREPVTRPAMLRSDATLYDPSLAITRALLEPTRNASPPLGMKTQDGKNVSYCWYKNYRSADWTQLSLPAESAVIRFR